MATGAGRGATVVRAGADDDAEGGPARRPADRRGPGRGPDGGPRARRIVSLWLPRLGAERLLRRAAPSPGPFATVEAARGALRLASLSAEAETAGLARGMGLADARAIRPDLATRPADPAAEAALLAALARWAGRYSPWVAADGDDGLALDVTGCAHLFGGEAALLADALDRLASMGFTARAACADARGAAWGLARFAAGPGPGAADGDAVAADAPATRVRAPARAAWEKARPAPPAAPVVAPPGRGRAAVAGLPVAALRLPPETVEAMARLGLRRVGDLALLPRGGLARRFGTGALRRLDQALGAEPEPVGAARAAPAFAARLSLPEPVGRTADVLAGLDRLLGRLCARLAEHGRGARRLRLTLRRVDRADLSAEVGLARPSRDAAMIAGLFARPVEALDAGFGIDALRLEAVETEPLAPLQHRGHLAARGEAEARAAAAGDGGEAFAALLSRLGGRLGFERLERLLPGDSHIPARAFVRASAAFADAPALPWPAPPGARPLSLVEPEPVDPLPDRSPAPPAAFRWRGRTHAVAAAFGPERIAPEWWLDDPAWRTGPRDYWRLETAEGLRLWLFHAPLSDRVDRWFAEGIFA